MFSPVVVFTYNRYEEAMKVLSALTKNIGADKTDVYIFSNAPIPGVAEDEEKVAKIRKHLPQFADAFHSYEVIYREKNEGSNANMYDGINRVVKQYGRVIVLEDDILTSPAFLSFMNQALDKYETDPEVFSICGYNPVTMESKLPGDSFSYDVFRSWGWAIWKDRWDLFSMEEDRSVITKIDLRKAHTEAMMYICAFQKDIPCPTHTGVKYLDYRLTRRQMADKRTVLYSKRSVCDNIGMDGAGLTTQEYRSYRNNNFSLGDRETTFQLSKERLDIDSDRDYFYKFRRDAFAIQAYENTNLDRNSMYLNMYYGIARLLAKNKVEKNRVFESYFRKNNWQDIAIYGWGDAGKLLYELLRDSSLNISYIVDRRELSGERDIPPAFQDALKAPKVDVMLITALRDFWNIQEQLYGNVEFPLVSMDDVINECLRKADEQEQDE